MDKAKIKAILKSYSVDAVKEGMTYAYNNKGQIREVLTDKVVEALADKLEEELNG